MPPHLSTRTAHAYPLEVNRSDRSLLYQRLQTLEISCWRLDDGSLWVEVNHAIEAVLVRSVVQQIMTERRELVGWLERCWRLRERRM